MFKMQHVRSNVQGALCKMECVKWSGSQTSWTDQLTDQLDGPAGRTSWTEQLDRPAVRTNCTDQLDRPAGQTSWTDQLDRPAGKTSSFYLKPWPVRIFKDLPFSLYIVNKGLVEFNRIKLVQLDIFPRNVNANLPKFGNFCAPPPKKKSLMNFLLTPSINKKKEEVLKQKR